MLPSAKGAGKADDYATMNDLKFRVANNAPAERSMESRRGSYKRNVSLGSDYTSNRVETVSKSTYGQYAGRGTGAGA